MSYNSFSPISEQDTTIFTKGWTNDVTRLNAANMNKLTDRVEMISSALLDSDGHGIIEEVNKFNVLLEGNKDRGKESLVNKVAYNSFYFLGYDYSDNDFEGKTTDQNKELEFQNYSSTSADYVNDFFNTPWSNIDALLPIVKNNCYDESYEKLYWTVNSPFINSESLASVVFSNSDARKKQYGAVAKLNFFNDVLSDHHSAIRNIGAVYKKDSIQYKINLNDTSYSHSIIAKSVENERNYFEITASGGVDIACGDNNVAVSITPDDTTTQSLSILTSGIVNSTLWEQNKSIVNVEAVKSKVIGDPEDNIIDNNTNNIDSKAPLTLCGLSNAIEHYAVTWQVM